MTLFWHEMRRGFRTLLIWTAVVAGMITVCMLLFPQMKGQMDAVNQMFSSMGGFTQAFGMDKIPLGTPMGFYGIEGGNILGIGGAFFAGLLGIRMLAKEEGEHTAEFLLTHPISRARVVSEKLLALLCQLACFNLICAGCAALSFAVIGEMVAWKAFALFHIAQYALQCEIACICLGLSAFLRRGGVGAGLGLAAFLYFLNLIGNIAEQASFVRYLTPFHYAEASDILSTATIDGGMLALGMLYLALGIAVAYVRYCRKDVAA